jgi:hypothetical protein
MWGDLLVEGAISVGGGVSVLTSASGYTKEQMNSTFNALNGTETTDTETVIIPDLVIIPKAPQETTYTKTEVDTILAQKANDETTYNKTEVDTILTQKANDETTYNKTQVDSLLDSKEPSFITVAPLLKNLNVETGTIDIILSEAFLSNIDGKVDQSYVDDELATKANTSDLSLLYQAKLKNESSIGYSVLGPDDKTVYSLEASSGIYLLPTYTMVDNVPSNYRIQIRVDELYTAQAQAYTNNAIAAIPSPFWCAGKVDGFSMAKLASQGRYGYSAWRGTNFPAGVYQINFNTPFASANYVITLTNQSTGHCKVWDSTLPTAEGFHIVVFNTSNALSNSIFHFSVIA